MSSTRFSHAEGVFTLDIPDRDITMILTHAIRSKDGLSGTLKVSTRSPLVKTTHGILRLGKINLMAPRTVEEWVKALDQAFDLPQSDTNLPWRHWLNELGIQTDAALRMGPPPLLMSEQTPPSAVAFTTLPGNLVVLDKLPMSICADGETGKSTLAAWMAGHLTAMGHRVLWLDWEEGPDDFTDKMHRLFPGMVPDVYYHYAKPYGPIWDQREALQERIRLLNITYLIVDSVAAAIAGSDGPESAANASRYFAEIGALGQIGSLHLAHVAKTIREDDGKARKKPTAFGSVFWQNFVRLAYFADTDDEGLTSTRTVALYRTKSNRLAKARVPHLALDFTYDDSVSNGAITVTPASLLDNTALSERLSFAQRILAALKHKNLTTGEMATHLYGSDDEPNRNRARAQLSKLEQQQKVINLAGRGGRSEATWGVLDGRYDNRNSNRN